MRKSQLKARALNAAENKGAKIGNKAVAKHFATIEQRRNMGNESKKARNELDKRQKALRMVHAGEAPRKTLDKMDSWHGTHFAKSNPSFSTYVKGKEKPYRCSKPLV